MAGACGFRRGAFYALYFEYQSFYASRLGGTYITLVSDPAIYNRRFLLVRAGLKFERRKYPNLTRVLAIHLKSVAGPGRLAEARCGNCFGTEYYQPRSAEFIFYNLRFWFDNTRLLPYILRAPK